MQKEKVRNTTPISPKPAKSSPARSRAGTQAKVASELKRLQGITKDAIPDGQRATAMPILANLAFQKVKLDEARAALMDEGIFTSYDNGGGQSGMREHPGFAAYNKLFATFSRGVKQITDMMPGESAASDALTAFLAETRDA